MRQVFGCLTFRGSAGLFTTEPSAVPLVGLYSNREPVAPPNPWMFSTYSPIGRFALVISHPPAVDRSAPLNRRQELSNVPASFQQYLHRICLCKLFRCTCSFLKLRPTFLGRWPMPPPRSVIFLTDKSPLRPTILGSLSAQAVPPPRSDLTGGRKLLSLLRLCDMHSSAMPASAVDCRPQSSNPLPRSRI
ncbi:hypothetical protein PGTUg99_020901 [Puccinia graminis f. sp. tritici]|uniref:Uncharacterized protein n=1 Tax=Puccinia graminis f. sp. tritici TaxID=56615 RepID=A0A5B0LKE4_PUCGR|nr:hypothetical protein PGTUg99_020901 [Puccinia graminis f. sp. tritici]